MRYSPSHPHPPGILVPAGRYLSGEDLALNECNKWLWKGSGDATPEALHYAAKEVQVSPLPYP